MITATEARNNLFKLLKQNKRVEIKHKSGNFVLIPKSELWGIEKLAMAAEMDRIRSTESTISQNELDEIIKAQIVGRVVELAYKGV